MDANDYESILNTCKKYDSKDLTLWINSLQYFSKREDYKCKEYISQILTYIDRYNLLSPLMVIKILSKNNTITFDTIKVRFKKKSANFNNPYINIYINIHQYSEKNAYWLWVWTEYLLNILKNNEYSTHLDGYFCADMRHYKSIIIWTLMYINVCAFTLTTLTHWDFLQIWL